MNGEPRLHLYVFAHQALPGLGHGNAAQMLKALTGPRCSEFLAFLWNDVGNRLEPKNRMEFPEISVVTKQRPGCTLALIHFPKPTEMTEPYYSAFVFGPLTGEQPLQSVGLRYFILEHSLSLPSGNPRTVLGEWTTEKHLNYGDGPEPSAEAFERSVWNMKQKVAP